MSHSARLRDEEEMAVLNDVKRRVTNPAARIRAFTSGATGSSPPCMTSMGRRKRPSPPSLLQPHKASNLYTYPRADEG